MERDVSYIFIGAFVIFFLIAIIFVVIWIGNTKSKKEYKFYMLKFRESVSGLNIGSSVKYKGIKIGSVEKMSIDPEDPDIIDVIIKIQKDIPIKEDSTAMLTYQGVTGLANIEIKGGSKYAKILEHKKGECCPEIKTEPSIIKRLDTTLSILSSQAQELVSNLNYLLSKQNIKKLMNTIENINLIVKNIADNNEKISNFIKNLSESSSKIPVLIDSTNKNINTLSLNVNLLLKQLQEDEKAISNLIIDKTNRFSNNSDKISFEFIKTLKDIQKTVKKIDLFLSTIEDRPSKIIYDNMLIKPGPGE